MATSGRAGHARALPSASSSAQSNGPAQATGAKRATPWVDAWSRCAVPNASITYTSHSAAIRRASRSSSAFSPSRKRTFSQSTISPGATSRPSSQSPASRTSRPSNSPSRRATGASENAGSGVPSFGRPEVRHDHHTRAGPCRVPQRRKRGPEPGVARHFAVLGRERSGPRGSITRRPARSSSVIARTFMSRVANPRPCESAASATGDAFGHSFSPASSHRPLHLRARFRGGCIASHQAAFISATVVSSIRFEKPHSLSYQATTLTSRPSMTRVSFES